MSTAIGKCAQTGCNAPIDSKCIEGFEDLTACPHFTLSTQDDVTDEGKHLLYDDDEKDTGEPAAREDLKPDMVALAGGDELTFGQSAVVTAATLARIIVLAGESESGKTTLLSTLITKFQRGPFAGYNFAGSRTLIGFEKRCHLARSASGLTKSDTERTKPEEEEKLLHLRVRTTASKVPSKDLLFTDITGEKFERMQDYTTECKEFEILRRADHFVLLLDGKRLADPARRQQAYRGGTLILRSCIESGMLDTNSYVDVLFAKYDLISTSHNADRNIAFLVKIQQRINEDYGESFGRLRFFKVAVRSAGPVALGADNFADIFSSWIEDTPVYTRKLKSTGLKFHPTEREFDRYMLRRSLVLS